MAYAHVCVVDHTRAVSRLMPMICHEDSATLISQLLPMRVDAAVYGVDLMPASRYAARCWYGV